MTVPLRWRYPASYECLAMVAGERGIHAHEYWAVVDDTDPISSVVTLHWADESGSEAFSPEELDRGDSRVRAFFVATIRLMAASLEREYVTSMRRRDV